MEFIYKHLVTVPKTVIGRVGTNQANFASKGYIKNAKVGEMGMKFIRFVAAMAVVVTMTSCSAASGNLTGKISFKKVKDREVQITGITDAVNVSGLNIFKQRVKNNNKGNVIVSPVSIFSAFSLLSNGADGDTKEEIEKAFYMENFDQQKLNEDMNGLMNMMNSNSEGMENTGSLNLYNSIWFNNSFSIRDSFLNTAKSYYDADVFKKDFSSKNTVNDMNAWADKKSDGLIKKPFDKLSEQDRIILINLLNFKGKWVHGFNKYKTKEEDFYLKDNTSVKVDMMNSENMMSYYEDGEVKSCILNYYNGRMILLLPNGNIDEYINNLSIDKIKSYTENTTSSNVKLKLPKFDLEYKEDISEVLKQLGIKNAFDSSKASFKLLHEDTEPLWVGNVLHDCVVKVDEEGTSGAALTAVLLCGAALPKGTHEMYINKPFLFIIQDNSGANLFMGKIDNAAGK